MKKVANIVGILLILIGILAVLALAIMGIVNIVMAISPWNPIKMIIGVLEVVFCGVGFIISYIGMWLADMF